MQQADVEVGENLVAQLAVHLLGGFEFALFVLFDHGIDDVGLMSGGDLLADEVPDFGGALVGDAAGDDGRAARREFVDDAETRGRRRESMPACAGWELRS